SSTLNIYTLSLHDALPICSSGYTQGLGPGILSIGIDPRYALKKHIEVKPQVAQIEGQSIGDFGNGVPEFYIILEINFTIVVDIRSEEHTSKLQSRENIVCR